MHRRAWHGRGYHEWARETPVVDAIGAVLGVGSVIVGGYATLFLAAALRDGNRAIALENLEILITVGLANVTLDGVRYWRRHHD